MVLSGPVSALSLIFSSVLCVGQTPLPDGKARPTFEKLCGGCHDVDQVTSKRHSAAGWQAVIDDMVSKGATAKDEEFDAIAAYLTEHFGPLNVNKASAKDLADFLGVPPEQGVAIVRYREKAGQFKDLDALKKVPGLDGRIVEKKKDGLSF